MEVGCRARWPDEPSEIDGAIRDAVAATHVGRVLGTRGFATVARDDQGNLVQHRPQPVGQWLRRGGCISGSPVAWRCIVYRPEPSGGAVRIAAMGGP